ncbi:integrase catalytic domain-containing protein [Trichonephila clavipes]|nr:integrase catalytic domain-containing protein [Trichonephila clavipes]
MELARIKATLPVSGESQNTVISGAKKKLNLPKLEFRQFSGDIKDWLQFWSQFQHIQEDDKIAPENKFQHFVQATVNGSRARVIESLPAIAANYAKAADSLQARFGRDDLLMERIRLRNQDNNVTCNLEALDQTSIRNNIASVTPGSWISELDEMKIQLSDIGEESRAVQVLIGSDVIGKLITGQHRILSCELVAMETILGWTVRFGVSADIWKAFLQISLYQQDRNFLRFLWHSEEELIHYRHCRMVFGVSSSPFLLGSTIQYHLEKKLEEAKQGRRKYPECIVQKLMSSFYVDNCLTSVQTQSELDRFIDVATEIMAERKFDLRGWEHSNPSDLIGTLTHLIS